LKYFKVEGGLQSEVVVNIDIKKNDSIVAYEGYRLKSPIMKDSIIDDFFDLRRYPLKPGNYSLVIELKDLNTVGESIKAASTFVIDDFGSKISMSDIQVSEIITKGGDESSLFYKSGFTMIPNFSSFYSKELTKLPVYFEVYNSKKLQDSLFGIKQTIIDNSTQKEITEPVFTKCRKDEVVPFLKAVDISSIPTGNYTINYSLINKEMKEVASTSYVFERSNDIELTINSSSQVIDPAFQASIKEDSVSFYLASLIPMSKSSDVKSILEILKSKNKENARKYIQAFWSVTSANNPYEGWMKYKAQVDMVEKLYRNNFQAGFETDRGRVYLQYGPPTNVIQKEVSSTEYPYEIWQYNKIEKFSNKRFIFYNPDLVNNAYRLLHSDMIGELKNQAWQLALNKRNTTNGSIDDPNQNIQQSYGGNSYNNFRQY
jgi:GWxTD domain-containing protein